MHLLCLEVFMHGRMNKRVQGKLPRNYVQLWPQTNNHRRSSQLFLGWNFFLLFILGMSIKLHWHRKWLECIMWHCQHHRIEIIERGFGTFDIDVWMEKIDRFNGNNGCGNYLLLVSLPLNIRTMLRCRFCRYSLSFFTCIGICSVANRFAALTFMSFTSCNSFLVKPIVKWSLVIFSAFLFALFPSLLVIENLEKFNFQTSNEKNLSVHDQTKRPKQNN